MKNFLIGIIILIGAGYGIAKFYLHYKVSESLESAVIAVSPYGDLTYGGISSSLSGELTVDDVRVDLNDYRDDLVIGRMGINSPDFLTLITTVGNSSRALFTDRNLSESLGFIVEDFRITANSDYYNAFYEESIALLTPADLAQRGVQCVGKYGYSPKVLSELGYNNILTSMSITIRQGKNEDIAEMSFDLTDMVAIEIDLRMMGSLVSVATGAGYLPRLKSLQVKITDQSLNARVRKYCTELGLSPVLIQAAHLNALQYFGKSYGIVFDRYVIDPYKEFLAGKSTLVVSAKPREPLDLTKISKYNPSDVPALLNLEAWAR